MLIIVTYKLQNYVADISTLLIFCTLDARVQFSTGVQASRSGNWHSSRRHLSQTLITTNTKSKEPLNQQQAEILSLSLPPPPPTPPLSLPPFLPLSLSPSPLPSHPSSTHPDQSGFLVYPLSALSELAPLLLQSYPAPSVQDPSELASGFDSKWPLVVYLALRPHLLESMLYCHFHCSTSSCRLQVAMQR